MPGHTCVVCGNTHTQDPDASFHRLPSDPARRASWLDAFKLDEFKLAKNAAHRYITTLSSFEYIHQPQYTILG